MSAAPLIDPSYLSKMPEKDWESSLIVSKTGAPKALLANAITALRECPDWCGVLAYNEFALTPVALKSPPWGSGSIDKWTDHHDRLTADWLQHNRIDVSVDTAGQAIQVVAKDAAFHPVRKYLNELHWDGQPRIDRWTSDYLGAAGSEYAAAVGSRWLISAVARIFDPGCKADCVFILEGPQGALKSTSLRTIAGEWFTDEIGELGTKDAAMQTMGVWIIELSELDSLTRSEVGRVKAFISRSTDRFRPPYGKRLIEAPRQCIFAGSVNHGSYLKDETGGRRFWPVPCGRIDIDHLGRDRDQLWAEAVHRYRSGSNWWLDSEGLSAAAAEEQRQRYDGDSWDSVIADWIEGREFVTVAKILDGCLNKKTGDWTQTDQNRVSRSLRSLGWQRYQQRTEDGTREWRYRAVTTPSPVCE